MMDGLNLDPGLRQAYNQQTHQRLLAESTHARLAKSVRNQNPNLKETKSISLVEKVKIIGQIIRASSSEIITVVKKKNKTLNA
jgi:hypothetical protein